MASPNARRRQRSTRLVVAVALIVASGVLLAAVVPTGSFLAVAVSGLVAVLLGAAALRIAHSELMTSRRDAAADRASQAKEYAELAARRSEENAEFIASVEGRISDRDDAISAREKAISDLEEAVELAQAKVVELTRRADAEAKRADAAVAERDGLRRQLQAAEDRAAEAIVRLAELEQELDVVRADLLAWEGSHVDLRKHA